MKLFKTLFSKKKTSNTRFNVEGMSCGSCAERVENAIRQLPGISSVRVDLASGDVLVEHQGDKVTPEQVQQQIATAGYTATMVAK